MAKHKRTGDEHRDDERIVELVSVPSRFEADVIVAKLESAGIKANVSQNDAAGLAPHYATLDGHIVYVFQKDLKVARELLAEQ
jgi:hypothetical protein